MKTMSLLVAMIAASCIARPPDWTDAVPDMSRDVVPTPADQSPSLDQSPAADLTDDTDARPLPTHYWVKVTSGQNFACGLTNLGRLACWGSNNFVVALQPEEPAAPPRWYFVAERFDDIDAGANHVCTVTDGVVKCWGANATGQVNPALPSGGENTLQIPYEGKVTSVSAGLEHTCVIDAATRSVVCWGSNQSGESNPDSADPVVEPTSSALAARQVSAGDHSTCIRDESDIVHCWGANSSRQSAPDSGDASVAISALNSREYSSVSAGSQFGCAITVAEQSVECWGASGEARTALPIDQPEMPLPNGVEGASLLAAGDRHGCAAGEEGLQCWGVYAPGSIAASPTTVWGPRKPQFEQLDAGRGFTCGVASRFGYCWGDNGAGELGQNEERNVTFESSTVPLQVRLPPDP